MALWLQQLGFGPPASWFPYLAFSFPPPGRSYLLFTHQPTPTLNREWKQRNVHFLLNFNQTLRMIWDHFIHSTNIMKTLSVGSYARCLGNRDENIIVSAFQKLQYVNKVECVNHIQVWTEYPFALWKVFLDTPIEMELSHLKEEPTTAPHFLHNQNKTACYSKQVREFSNNC